MIESNIVEGAQPLSSDLVYGKSITDVYKRQALSDKPIVPKKIVCNEHNEIIS